MKINALKLWNLGTLPLCLSATLFSFLRNFVTLPLCAFVTLLIGCARLQPALKKGLPITTPPGLEAHAQYAPSSSPRLGYNTFEVYIANRTKNTLVFTGAELNGNPLPTVRSDKINKLFAAALGEGSEIQVSEPGFPADSPVTWWQYYPDNELKPGAAIEFQVNFKAQNVGRRDLRLRAASAATENLDILVPLLRFRPPDKRFTAIAYSLDGKRMFIQYAAHKVEIGKLYVNGRKAGFKTRKSAADDTPDMVALNAPSKCQPGDALHVRAEFKDGDRRDALVRVLPGIVLDGGLESVEDEARICEEYGLDEQPAINLLPFDVTCSDWRSGQHGQSAPAVAEKRRELYRQSPGQLTGVGYCVAWYPGLWNIYGQISDVIYAKPYRLGWGHDPRRFIEEEEECMKTVQAASAPRPWLWIPERFNKAGRYLEPAELRVLAWIALARGAKGIRYHFWKNGENPFQGCPLLPTAVKSLNAEARQAAAALAPLVFVSERLNKDGNLKIYTAWSGDAGILIMLRNLDYATMGRRGTKEATAGFRVRPIQNAQVPVDLPAWFRPGAARDLLTGQRIRGQAIPNGLLLQLETVHEIKLIWLD